MLWRKMTRRLLEFDAYEARFPGIPPPVPGARIINVSQNNMPNQPVSDPQYWRDLAGNARAKADQTIDDRTKRLLLRIAESHERVAERVELRLLGAKKSK
jgi:hypothetical protein